jgi:hypothetical protein
LESELTEDMMRLLCIIDEYTKGGEDENPIWVKDLPLMSLIYMGIIKGIFRNYDYAPWSVTMLDGTRQWLNISREGKDDLEDLLNIQMIAILRVSTAQYGYVTAYRLTDLGNKALQNIPEYIKKEVHSLTHGECDKPMSVLIRDRKFFFKCASTKTEIPIPIDEIEDVTYETKSFLPSFNYGWWGVKKGDE